LQSIVRCIGTWVFVIAYAGAQATNTQLLYARGMRLLVVVRLSDLTDESTSPERQRGRIDAYARLYEHEVVGLRLAGGA
jgi:hypothetical protein